MSQNRRILTSLDIGTTSIKVIIAEIINNNVNVIGVSAQPSSGIKKGVIVDIDQTVSSIRQAVAEAERKANARVEELIIGLPAYGLDLQYTRGVVKTENPEAEISDQDIQNVVSQALIQAVAPDKELMGLNIKQFIVDGFDDIADPRGMIGLRLEIEAEVYSVPKTILHSLKKCVSMAGYYISDIVTQPDALAAAALSREKQRHASILIDMGGGQTTATVYDNQQIQFSFVDPEGGEYVSRDLSVVLNTTLEEAERLKINHGYAHPADANPDSQIAVNVLSQKGVQLIDEEYIVEIIHARLVQILSTVYERLNDERLLEGVSEIIVSGGNASIPGLKRVFENIFEKDFVLFVPQQMGIRYPTFSTAIGLIQYVKELDDVQRRVNSYVNQIDMHFRSPKKSESLPTPKTEPEPEYEASTDSSYQAKSQGDKINTEAQVQQEESDLTYQDNHQGRSQPSFFDKIKDFFSSFFD